MREREDEDEDNADHRKQEKILISSSRPQDLQVSHACYADDVLGNLINRAKWSIKILASRGREMFLECGLCNEGGSCSSGIKLIKKIKGVKYYFNI